MNAFHSRSSKENLKINGNILSAACISAREEQCKYSMPIERQSGGVSEVICAQGHTAICVLWHFSKWPIRRPPKISHKRLREYFRSQAITLFQSELFSVNLFHIL